MASSAPPDRQVLPSSVVPTHYLLSLTPHFDTFKYAGAVNVTLDVDKPTSKIVLNALDLELHLAEVTTKAGTQKATDISVDVEKQEATLEFEDELKVGKGAAQLRIEFTGVLNDKMAGFYRSSYIDGKTGEKKWLATTQMGKLLIPPGISWMVVNCVEPTDARRSFPCWVDCKLG
jgi:aminopeptidase 2